MRIQNPRVKNGWQDEVSFSADWHTHVHTELTLCELACPRLGLRSRLFSEASLSSHRHSSPGSPGCRWTPWGFGPSHSSRSRTTLCLQLSVSLSPVLVVFCCVVTSGPSRVAAAFTEHCHQHHCVCGWGTGVEIYIHTCLKWEKKQFYFRLGSTSCSEPHSCWRGTELTCSLMLTDNLD